MTVLTTWPSITRASARTVSSDHDGSRSRTWKVHVADSSAYRETHLALHCGKSHGFAGFFRRIRRVQFEFKIGASALEKEPGAACRSSLRRRSKSASRATTIVDMLMAMAPTLIGKSTPQRINSPAATGMSTSYILSPKQDFGSFSYRWPARVQLHPRHPADRCEPRQCPPTPPRHPFPLLSRPRHSQSAALGRRTSMDGDRGIPPPDLLCGLVTSVN